MNERTMHLTHGLVRTVSRSLASCELLHVPRKAFDLERARRQHDAYVAALRQEGVSVAVLPEAPDLPDAAFVEDAVVMLDEFAVICRCGVASRLPETELLEREITSLRPVRRIVAPGTLEGGDVLLMDRTLHVGLSTRTNEAGVRQLKELASPFGYRVNVVAVKKCLHLKTGVTSPAEGLLLLNPEWVDARRLAPWQILHVPREEPWGANVLAVNGAVLAAESAPRTADLLEEKGLRVRRLEVSELQKAEAGPTCLSILYRGGGAS